MVFQGSIRAYAITASAPIRVMMCFMVAPSAGGLAPSLGYFDDLATSHPICSILISRSVKKSRFVSPSSRGFPSLVSGTSSNH